MIARHAVTCLLVPLLLVCVVSSSLAQGRGLGHRPPTPEEQAYIDAVYTRVTHIAPNDLARARAQAEAKAARLHRGTPPASASLPAAVDNSTLQYFPPIGNQGGQGSCTCWAGCYYYNTFTQAADENRDVSTWDPDHTCSPAFMYPLVNGGGDNGANTQYVVARLSDIGCSNWTLKPYSQSDWTTWPSEAAWVQALENRTQTPHVIDGSTPSGLDTIKQHLANGNLAATDSAVFRTWYWYYPADGTGVNNGVYYYPDGPPEGGHAVTIVGYSDSKSYVDHRDGQTHYGAFLMANSWGNIWGVRNSTGLGSKGFFWVAYSMFLESTFGPYAYYNDDRDNYRPRLYAVAGINHSQRGYVYLGSSTAVPTCWDSYAPIYFDGGTALPVTDTNRIAVDMTDGIPLGPVQILGRVLVIVDPAASTDATITSADFYQDFDGDGSYDVVSSTDPPVTIAPGVCYYAEAMLNVLEPALQPDVLLEVHPDERAQGRAAGPGGASLGGPYWVDPINTARGSYWWKEYRFAASGVLWVQVCAQNWTGTQNGDGDDDNTKVAVNGVALADYDGIQSGAPGGWQWIGATEAGQRWTLRFLYLGQGGLQRVEIAADQAPVLWWVKVTDLEPQVIEP